MSIISWEQKCAWSGPEVRFRASVSCSGCSIGEKPQLCQLKLKTTHGPKQDIKKKSSQLPNKPSPAFGWCLRHVLFCPGRTFNYTIWLLCRKWTWLLPSWKWKKVAFCMRRISPGIIRHCWHICERVQLVWIVTAFTWKNPTSLSFFFLLHWKHKRLASGTTGFQ